jgi:hypothetical protein
MSVQSQLANTFWCGTSISAAELDRMRLVRRPETGEGHDLGSLFSELKQTQD